MTAKLIHARSETALGAGADPIAATRRVDESEHAKTESARFDRRAFAANAVLFALRQRGEGLFTAICVQVQDNIAQNLEVIALGLDASERIPEGSNGSTGSYSGPLAKVTEAVNEIIAASASQDAGEAAKVVAAE